MKCKIVNYFEREGLLELDYYMNGYSEGLRSEKYRDGRLIEFSSIKELDDFIKKARAELFMIDHPDVVEVRISPNSKDDCFDICINEDLRYFD